MTTFDDFESEPLDFIFVTKEIEDMYVETRVRCDSCAQSFLEGDIIYHVFLGELDFALSHVDCSVAKSKVEEKNDIVAWLKREFGEEE